MTRWKRSLAAAVTGLALAGCADSSDTETVAEPSAETVAEPSAETVAETSGETVAETSGETVAETSGETTTTPVDDIASMLTAARATHAAPGVLAVVDVDGQRWFGQSGTADVDDTPISRTTRFRIASISKPLTAALVLDAVQRGELTLDDDVDALVPGLLDPGEPVTVRMLLNHTSGIFDQTNNRDILDDIALLTDPEQITEANDLANRYLAGEAIIVPDRLLVALAEAHGRDFAPGVRHRYGNLNYQVAAIVLETVTGQPIAELLQERLAAPLGVEHTTIAPPDLAAPELRGYERSADDGSLVDVTDDLGLFGNGASGGVISTADELLTMLKAINGNELLDAALLAEMRDPLALSAYTYGLGLATHHLSCGKFYGHGGLVNGTMSIALVSEDGSDGVVIALNLLDDSELDMLALADDLICPRREG